MNNMSMTKRLSFWAIMLMLPVLFLLVAVEGYYLYGYLAFRADFCGSFSKLDGEIGWVPTPGARSCIIGYESAFGKEAFRAEVTIDRNGARVPRPTDGADSAPAMTAAGTGVLAIGDSMTFGYGIDGKDTFAARLTRDYATPTTLVASPAYSGAQALLLGRRAAVLMKPRAIIYLGLGFWGRSVCTGDERPTILLKPCYWTDETGRAQLVTPRPGLVASLARLGLRPGGMVGAGEMTLGYFLISRPLANLRGMMVRLGLMSGPAHDFRPVAPADQLEAIKLAHYRELVSLARSHDAQLILIDPKGYYLNARAGSARYRKLTYIDRKRWQSAVGGPMQKLPKTMAYVPYDEHYGPGTHGLIAALIHEELLEIR